MPPATLGTIIVAAIAAIGVTAGGIVAWRKYRRRNEIFISYPTMFGTAHIYTVRRDPDQDVLDQFGNPLADAKKAAAHGNDLAAGTGESGANEASADETDGAHADEANAGEAIAAHADEPTEETVTWVRVLELDGALQSATYLDDDRCYDLVFDYYKLYNHLFEANIPIRSMLMLGGGGYAYPKFVISHFPDISMDVVEIDPSITALAERYFFLDRLIVEFDTESTDRLGLFNEDGRAYLKRCEKTYDVVLNDTFAGKKPALQLASIEAMQLAKTHLSPGGMYLTNVVSSLSGPNSRTLRLVCNTLAHVFSNVYILSSKRHVPQESENYIIIATDGDYAFSGVVQKPQFTRTDEVLKDQMNDEQNEKSDHEATTR